MKRDLAQQQPFYARGSLAALALLVAIATPARAQSQDEGNFLFDLFADFEQLAQQTEDFSFFDTLQLADAAARVRHPIPLNGHCSFFAARGRRWTHKFPDGAALEATCDPDPGSLLPGYHLWYKDSRGRIEIARCIFDNGLNSAWYYTSADSGRLTGVAWVNVDGGPNDGGKHGVGRRIDRVHFAGPEEPFLDVVTWLFQPDTKTLECLSDKFEYAVTPRLPRNPRSRLDPYVGRRVASLRRSFVTEFPR